VSKACFFLHGQLLIMYATYSSAFFTQQLQCCATQHCTTVAAQLASWHATLLMHRICSRAGDVATGNFTILNAGTLNLTSVTYGVVNETDPRVAAIIIACKNFAQNGTLPAGASLLQCTEQLSFSNVTFIEPGDVVFNLTAAADGVSQQSRQVTIHVDNTPSLSMKVNSSQCTAPRRAGASGMVPTGTCRAS